MEPLDRLISRLYWTMRAAETKRDVELTSWSQAEMNLPDNELMTECCSCGRDVFADEAVTIEGGLWCRDCARTLEQSGNE